MSLKTHNFYDFKDFRLDYKEKVLLRNGKAVSITPKVYETLLVLIENAGRLLEKDDLMQKIWQDRFVEESNLTFNIKMLRKALGDDAQKPQFIETVPRRGYRFIAEVRRVDAEAKKLHLADEKTVSNLNAEPHLPASFPRKINRNIIQSSGAVVALADWKHEKAAVNFDEETSKPNEKTAKLELVPALPIVQNNRRNYLFVVIGLISVLVLSGYGLYKMANRDTSVVIRSNISRLTSNGKTQAAAVSPDGKFVVYIVEDEEKRSLWLKNVAANTEMQVIAPDENARLYGVTFSPDSNFIYYGANGKLYQLPVLGSASKLILPKYGGFISFSPDGKQFTFPRFLSEPEETSQIIAVNSDGTNERVIASSKRPNLFLRSPVWSPDGKNIAIVALNASGNQEIVTVRVDDGVVSSVPSSLWDNIWSIVWKSDGKGFFVAAIESKKIISQIWSLSYPDGEKRKITDDSHNYRNISFASAANLLIAVRAEQETHLWTMPTGADTSRAKQITSGFEKYDGIFAINWTNENKIIYENSPSGLPAVSTIDQDGRNLKELVSEIGVVCASPDGKYLIHQKEDANGIGLFRRSVADGQEKRLTRGTDLDAAFTPDEKWIVFTRYADDVALWKVSIEGGKEIKLTDFSGLPMAAAVSPDGKFIAFHRGKSGDMSFPALAVISIDGGEIVKEFDVRIETPQGFNKAAVQWTADGNAIDYIAQQNGVSNLWRQPLDESRAFQITNFEAGKIFNFASSQDGKQLALSRGNSSRDVIQINNVE